MGTFMWRPQKKKKEAIQEEEEEEEGGHERIQRTSRAIVSLCPNSKPQSQLNGRGDWALPLLSPDHYAFIVATTSVCSSKSSIALCTSSIHVSLDGYWRIAFTGQKRGMFIQTQSTPNPLSLMFYPGKPVMEVGSADFPNAHTAMTSPLAKSLFAIDGISRVFFGADFVTVTKSEEVSWDYLKPEIFAAIMDFYSSGKPIFLDSNTAASMDTAIQEDDSETVAMIKELLETRIRPSVQDDGGDIEYRGFDPETGIVKLKMQGACSGCPSSSVTLKSGIENMLMHYVPEVKGVEEELDNIDEETPLSGQLE